MRTGQNFWLFYVLLAIAQMVLCNYLQLSPWFVLTILPAMVLCIPLQVKTSLCMVIAFVTGLAVDLLSEGIAGMNAAALLPVALLRKPAIRIFLGEDLISRGDSFSFRKNGTQKIFFALFSLTFIFLTIYILLDGAGTRPLWFNAVRFAISMAADMLLALAVSWILTPEERR